MFTRRDIPKIDELLKEESIQDLLKKYDLEYIKDILRNITDDLRKNYSADNEHFDPRVQTIINTLKNRVVLKSKLKTVINATGVVLHTNLGRSILSDDVLDEVKRVSTSYSNLEFSLDDGKRGSRYNHLTEYFIKLTGAEDVHIVNNNAAATILVLNTLAKDKEVIVSRGELVEIGGSFRVPDIMKLSGCILKEIGTTNITKIDDYSNAINENTGLLMKVHKSNYYISGFTKEANSEEIVAVSNDKNIPFYEDLGSGSLVELEIDDIKQTLKQKFDSGVDIVSISGDKLLGGPQAGIILGKKKYIEKMKKNQYTRAFRVCKLTLSALEATLKKYIENKSDEIPTISMLKRSKTEIKKLSEELVEKFKSIGLNSNIVEYNSIVGGGSLPKVKLDSYRIELEVSNVNKFYDNLRKQTVPVIGIINDNKFCLDLRCVKQEEIDIIVESVRRSI